MGRPAVAGVLVWCDAAVIETRADVAPSSDGFTRRPFPPARRFVVRAMRAGRSASPMHGLVQIDVTEPLERLETHGGSLTAFVLASVARAVARHPDVHAYRDFLGRLVVHDSVDVATMIEVQTERGPFPLAHVVVNAANRSVGEITDEIRRVKREPRRSRSGRWLTKLVAALGRIPFLLGLFYWTVARSVAARRRVGTVTLTTVGMFLGGSGHGIGVQTIMPLTVLVGGITERPWVVDGEVTVRKVLDLTVTIDHAIVDGAPAARFGATLREQLESGAALGE
jgi:pyruvate/2-oxoglutarate dehydrogenase complex dihydrolipoamide acyltransferase (E2) component